MKEHVLIISNAADHVSNRTCSSLKATMFDMSAMSDTRSNPTPSAQNKHPHMELNHRTRDGMAGIWVRKGGQQL